ncbi:hypothetical protein JCM3765_001386 [Sporobolomyces pararoseus]
MLLTSSSRRLLKLPIEIKHCIISHLSLAPPPLPPRRVIPLPRYHSSSPSASSSLSHLTLSTPHSQPSQVSISSEQQEEETAFIFESPLSPEYTSIPPSTLDYPSTSSTSSTTLLPGITTARSPTESLLNLLKLKQFKTASTLLKELQQTEGESGGIETSYQFSTLGVDQLFFFNSSSNSTSREERNDWLKWLEFVPEPLELITNVKRIGGKRISSSSSRKQSLELRRLDSNFLNLTIKISRELVKNLQQETSSSSILNDNKNEREGEEEDEAAGRKFVILEEMKEFGKILNRKGQTRIVAQELITAIALQGKDVQGALELWEHCLIELNRQTNNLKEYESSFDDDDESRGGGAQKRIERWLKTKNQESLKVLIRARESIIKALTNLGRVDESIPILLSSAHPHPLQPVVNVKLSKNFYLTILSQLASQDRFDWFEKVYKQFTVELNNKLVRIENENLRIRSPYLARKSNYHGHHGGGESPSAQEAFTTFRDQHRVSSIEEGPPAEEIISSSNDERSAQSFIKEFSSMVGKDFEHYGRLTSNYQSLKLIYLVESSRLDSALDLLTSLLVRGPLPSAQSVSILIESVKNHHSNGKEILEMFSDSVEESYWRRSFWNTCRMLNDLQSGDLNLVVRRFRDYFNLMGLPNCLITAIKGVTIKTPSTRTIGSETSTSNSYTFSILLQALIPLLSSNTTSRGASAGVGGGEKHLMKNIFLSLFNPTGFDIIPSNHHHLDQKSDLTLPLHEKKSPLDPYSFIPFLLLTLERKFPLSPPTPTSHFLQSENEKHLPREEESGGVVVQEVLEILISMQKIGIKPQLPHLSLLLSGLATAAFSSSSSSSNTSTTTTTTTTNSWSREFKILLNCLEEDQGIRSSSKDLDGLDRTFLEFIRIQFPSTTKNVEPPLHHQGGGGGGQELSPKLYATLLKSLRLSISRQDRLEPSISTSNNHDEKRLLIRNEAMMVLQRLMERIGVEGLREMLNSKDGESLRIEVGRLGIQ